MNDDADAATLWLSAGPEAVDAALVSKRSVVETIVAENAAGLRAVAAIGNGVNDIPFLELPALALVGAPVDSQPEVLRLVRGRENGYVATEPGVRGFVEFYERCAVLGIERVVTDRDGVFMPRHDPSDWQRIAAVVRQMGRERRPRVYVVTGASRDDNDRFVGHAVVKSAIDVNPALAEDGRLVFAENGSFVLDVAARAWLTFLEPPAAALRRLKDAFEPEVVRHLATDLAEFGVGVAFGDRWAPALVHVVPKRTMVTVNLPLASSATDVAGIGDRVIRRMETAARALGMPTAVLGRQNDHFAS